MGRRTGLTRVETLPDFVIIGALRSGTTSLARNLGAHPEVFMAFQKEVRFFDRHFDKGTEWYGRQFWRAGPESTIGEASPTYMYDDAALSRMKGTLPHARLIAILRHPVDRAYSHYWMNRALGSERLEFDAALEMEAERMERGELHFAYADRSRYVKHLLRVCAHFPGDSLHVALFEDFRDEPVETFRSVCRFLDVDDAFVPSDLGRQMNAFVSFRSATVRRATRGLPRPARNLVGRLNARRSTYPALDPRVRASVAEHFEEANAALASWLGRDLSRWRA